MFDEQGLKNIQATLAADGYALDAQEDGTGVVVVRISAMPEACEDCLSPPEVLRAILGKILVVPAESIELHYPHEAL